MFSSWGTVRYEERGQGYRGVEKIGKHCSKAKLKSDGDKASPCFKPFLIRNMFLYLVRNCTCISLSVR